MSWTTVKDSDGTPYIVSNTVLDGDGTAYQVNDYVADEDGTLYLVFSAVVEAAIRTIRFTATMVRSFTVSLKRQFIATIGNKNIANGDSS